MAASSLPSLPTTSQPRAQTPAGHRSTTTSDLNHEGIALIHYARSLSSFSRVRALPPETRRPVPATLARAGDLQQQQPRRRWVPRRALLPSFPICSLFFSLSRCSLSLSVGLVAPPWRPQLQHVAAALPESPSPRPLVQFLATGSSPRRRHLAVMARLCPKRCPCRFGHASQPRPVNRAKSLLAPRPVFLLVVRVFCAKPRLRLAGNEQ